MRPFLPLLISRCGHLSAPRLFLALLAGALLSCLAGTSGAVAQVPRLLHYQATLVEGDFPVEGPVNIEAAFFADPTDGMPLAGWTEVRTDVPVASGRLSLLLGEQTPFPDALFAVSPLYLQITADGEPLPRIQLGSSAFALRAGVAEAVAPGTITAAALTDASVTPAAMADAAVLTRALADRSVTPPKLADAAVTAPKLAPQSVTTTALAEGAVTSVNLGGRAVVESALADGAVATRKLANGAVTAAKVAAGQLVTTLNGLTDGVRLVGGDNVTITPNPAAGTIIIEADRTELDADGADAGLPSSRRWKTDVRPLDGLDLVTQLRGVRYRWTDSGRPDVGLIAEEVGGVVPEVVTYASNGIDAESVDYARLVAVLVEAVKAQQSQIEETNTQLLRLQRRLSVLEQPAPPR